MIGHRDVVKRSRQVGLWIFEFRSRQVVGSGRPGPSSTWPCTLPELLCDLIKREPSVTQSADQFVYITAHESASQACAGSACSPFPGPSSTRIVGRLSTD